MNFKRIELIFLATFIAIDIFLFGMFQQTKNMQAENVSQGNTNSTIIKEMRNDQIKVGDLSDKNGSAYYASGTQDQALRNQVSQLENQTVRFQNDELQSDFKSPIDMNDNAKQTINNKLKDPTFISFGDQYRYNSELSKKAEIVYTQTAFNYPIYSQQGEIRFKLNSNNQIVSYTQQYLDNIISLREQSETISQERALILLYQYNGIPNNTEVAWIKLGYTKYISVDNNQVLIPTWVIALKVQNDNSDSYVFKRINAFSGSLIKENYRTLKEN